MCSYGESTKKFVNEGENTIQERGGYESVGGYPECR